MKGMEELKVGDRVEGIHTHYKGWKGTIVEDDKSDTLPLRVLFINELGSATFIWVGKESLKNL